MKINIRSHILYFLSGAPLGAITFIGIVNHNTWLIILPAISIVAFTIKGIINIKQVEKETMDKIRDAFPKTGIYTVK